MSRLTFPTSRLTDSEREAGWSMCHEPGCSPSGLVRGISHAHLLISRSEVVHYHAGRPGRTICGRLVAELPFDAYTDDIGTIEDREGSRCRACWRVIVARGLSDRGEL